MKNRIKRIHFVGIGGIGMSGLAEILNASGYSVSGSDLSEGASVMRLRDLGISVTVGHQAEAVRDADVVVYSAAVSGNNPEIQAADSLHIPVIPRAEMLAELMRVKYGVAIAGSHGKTTTTSLAAAILQQGDLDPTVVVGGIVRSLGSNSRLGHGDVLIAEADESDGSFLRLAPTLVVVTNIDREHLDHYESFDRIKLAFEDFCNRVPFYGGAIVCLDDPVIQELLPRLTRRVETYGLSTQANLTADQIRADGTRMYFRTLHRGRELGEISLRIPGIHNVRNSLAAIAIGLELDVPFARIQDALAGFDGVARRFEILGDIAGVTVIDDYAHHPTEIRATLAAARAALQRRLVVVFQPHRYTRTRDVFEELATAFHDADLLIMTEIFAAGEDKIPGINTQALVAAAREHGHRNVHFVPDLAEIPNQLRRHIQSGDALLFLGAGDISRVARDFASGGSND